MIGIRRTREGSGPIRLPLSPSIGPPDRPCTVDLNDRQEEGGTRIEAREAIIKAADADGLISRLPQFSFPWLFRLTDDGPDADGGDDSSFCEND